MERGAPSPAPACREGALMPRDGLLHLRRVKSFPAAKPTPPVHGDPNSYGWRTPTPERRGGWTRATGEPEPRAPAGR